MALFSRTSVKALCYVGRPLGSVKPTIWLKKKVREAGTDLGFSERVAKAVKPVGKVVAKKTRNKAAKKSSGVIPYRDESGNTWTGHGKRPSDSWQRLNRAQSAKRWKY